ncbi:MAG: enoyl-CoA hydratase/isomerase family protein [Actinomycetota bacterium]|nr:enoyl-CoA hydratase/isomerase family protein [Actinomycetota bacterium]HCC45091.1 hypothetical protein [Gammaproteobacteria bacterium]
MIRVQIDESVTTVILDAPEVKNALTAEMINDVERAIQDAAKNEECRCLIIRGANGNFCTGRNLTEEIDQELRSVLKRENDWVRLFQQLRELRKPSVAVVEGYAVAGGFTLAMGCDFVIAEVSAVFGAFEMRNGFPAAVNTPLLAKLVGPRLALEWALLGEPIPAKRLFDMGLINRLVEDSSDLSAEANSFISQLIALDPSAVAIAKEIHHAARNMPLSDALAMGAQQNSLISASGWLAQSAAKFSAGRKQR